MKINEVETLVGITKRNIRFYEKEGLLAPGRDSANGYRNYGEEEIQILYRIKLLRKLDVPLEEIRKLEQNILNLDDVLKRHMIQLQRNRENLATVEALCQRLSDADEQLPTLDAQSYLTEMEQMEQEGTHFMNIKKSDTISRYMGPVGAAAIFVVLMACLMGFLICAFVTDPTQAPPLGITLFFVALPGILILGVLLALWQRIKQIQGGEEDAASKY